jgi:flagellar assembly factor FliW
MGVSLRSWSSTVLSYSTTRFGDLEVRDEDLIVVPEGLLGFASCKRYVLLEDPQQEPFLWFQSLDDPALAFVLVDPQIFFPAYQVAISREEISDLGIEDPAEARILVILVVSEDPARITANLKGPVVLNPRTRQAKQLVLMDEEYGTRHPILAQTPGQETT